ncbi:hypothetical protein I302_106256 [Kwoniella bestiolae CBS 10118]|uniref:Uncharacterized protein n=1 Tax=Kwoniella bestiolae CBS 10118 TaxID=1296100 RepID=A0A1B9G3H2_9TREE|nr:hypothetical protein I302_05380 [Kwoniella bestiolae CBS 10118]OCF25560.1 hypothetical protein I302_05380 [Kwoniella bestiolae CBS 10118]
MIASPQIPSIDLPEKPSPVAVQAARNAASNQHALINLIRLVKSLEVKVNSDDVDMASESYAAKKEWETVLYARALLDALKDGNEQSSSTSLTLSNLDKELSSVESSFRIRLTSPLPTPTLNPALIALPMTPNPSNPPPPPEPIASSPSQTSPPMSHPAAPMPSLIPPSDGVRKRRSKVDEYLAQRSKLDLAGSDEGLLPLKPVRAPRQSNNEPGARESLLAGTGPRSGIGSAQLHEELGGQLADMSHRLKLNAVHFSNSLENEKNILENSQNTLENNLTVTKSSKKHLSSVSSKGRSTTCLTIGVVVLVMVMFIWTYMLIRFT